MVLAWLFNGFLALFVIWAAAYMLQRGRGRKTREARRELVISPLSGLVAGAMLPGFEAIVQPQVRHLIVEEQKEQALEDEHGIEPLGGALLRLQLRQIRDGEDPGDLTVRTGR